MRAFESNYSMTILIIYSSSSDQIDYRLGKLITEIKSIYKLDIYRRPFYKMIEVQS